MTERYNPIIAYLNAYLKPEDDRDELPLLHRLAIVYLMLPVVVWLVGWFEWWFGVPAAVLLLLAFWKALSGSWRLRLRLGTVALLLVALGWVMMTAAGNVFDINNWDWKSHHRTLLLDLSRYPWPTYLPNSLIAYAPGENISAPLLRYHLGWYIVPGLVAHLFGPAALNWAVPLWTWLGIALILLLFTRNCRGYGIPLTAVILIFFSGMDIVRIILVDGRAWMNFSISLDNGWYKIGIRPTLLDIERDLWKRLIYPANATALRWSPHHFILTAIYSLLLLQLRRHSRFLSVVGVLLAAAPLGSVPCAIGLLPLLVVLFMENGVRPFLRWQNLLLVAPLAGLMVLYLTSYLNTGELTFFLSWMSEQRDWSMLRQWLLLFYLAEFAVLASLLWAARPQLGREPLFIFSLATLLLVPLIFPWDKYYNAYYLAKWMAFPSLFLLSYWCAEALGQHRVDIIRRSPARCRYALAGVVVALCVGAITPLLGMVLSIKNVGKYRYEEHSEDTSMIDLYRFQRWQSTATDIPDALRWLLRDNARVRTNREKGELVIRSNFDVYLEEDNLIYVKKPCDKAAFKPRVFLYVIPVDQSDLSAQDSARSFNTFYFNLKTYGHHFGETCVGRKALPEYDIAGFSTGQLTETGEVLWEATFAVGEDGLP